MTKEEILRKAFIPYVCSEEYFNHCLERKGEWASMVSEALKAMEDYSKISAVEEVDKWISPLNEIEFLKWLEKNNCHPEYYEEDGVEYSWLNETDGIFYTTSELYSIFLHFSAPKQDKQK